MQPNKLLFYSRTSHRAAFSQMIALCNVKKYQERGRYIRLGLIITKLSKSYIQIQLLGT